MSAITSLEGIATSPCLHGCLKLLVRLKVYLERFGDGRDGQTLLLHHLQPCSRRGLRPVHAIDLDPMAGRRHMQIPIPVTKSSTVSLLLFTSSTAWSPN
jgi:hypothetical protein